MEKQDMNLVCKECNNEFIWSCGEQNFLVGLLKDGKIQEIKKPLFCKDCREIIKKNRAINRLG